jgi:hypothetical protein
MDDNLAGYMSLIFNFMYLYLSFSPHGADGFLAGVFSKSMW